MTRKQILILTSLLFLFGCQSTAVDAGPRSEFRAYVANKLKQQDRIWLPFVGKKPGCHNMVITLEVYRVGQIGFDSCTIYSEKDCKPGSEIEVRWKNKNEPTTIITQGDRWFLPGETGSDMGSWNCKSKVDTGN